MQLKVTQLLAPTTDSGAGTVSLGPVASADYDQLMFVIDIGDNAAAWQTKIYAYADPVVAKTNKQAFGYWARVGGIGDADTEGTWTRYEAGAEMTTGATLASTQVLIAVDPAEAASVCTAAGYTATSIHLDLVEAADHAATVGGLVIGHPVRNKDTQQNITPGI